YEIGLQVLWQLGELGLRVLLEALPLDLLPLDFLFELRASGVAHHAAAGGELVLIRLQLLRLLRPFVLLFLAERLNLRRRDLAVCRLADDPLEVDEPDLGALRERRGG